MTVTPNMGMDLPVVSTTLGPTWATMLDAALDVVDAHDHTSGKGAQLPTAALDLDADLPFNGYNATLLRSTRYSDQGAALALATDLRCLYASGGELYYNDGNGTAVQITSNGAVLAGNGSIGGLPSGTAGVSFNSATGTYTFVQATNEAAPIDVGPVIIRTTDASSNGVTLNAPAALAADYDLTLPGSLPGVTSFLTLSSAGAIASGPALSAGIDTVNLANGAVTREKMEAVGQQISSSSTFSTASTVAIAVTTANGATANLSVTLTTSGRPVVIGLASAETGDGAIRLTPTTSGSFFSQVWILANGSIILGRFLAQSYAASSSFVQTWPVSACTTIYPFSAGTHTFQVYVVCGTNTATTEIIATKLFAYEL